MEVSTYVEWDSSVDIVTGLRDWTSEELWFGFRQGTELYSYLSWGPPGFLFNRARVFVVQAVNEKTLPSLLPRL